ncbi:MAG: PhzF family phenazine biosynthesis protein [Xanthomonadales bacterium]|nr:PhzF family phenazine biosynthesis protein [Xanthomonadales bacterium]
MQLDVFPFRAGGGNPLAVVHGAEDWDPARMQRLAAWLDLAETTFLLPPTRSGASYRLRIFTPRREIAFAGHPSIGSAHAAIELGLAAEDAAIVQECPAGLLPLRTEGRGETRRIFVRAPAARLIAENPAEPLLQRLLAPLPRGRLGPALVEGGRRWWLAEVAEERALRGYHADHAAIAALAHATDSLGLALFAPSADPAFDLVVRAFPAGVGIPEDPASGAANGLIAAYLALRGALAGPALRVSQGREIGHDALIELRVEEGMVWVGGRTDTIVEGRLRWP